jgi:transposase InsO family protein
VETRVRIARMLARRGPVWIGHRLGLPASTVGRILARHRTPLLRACDPLTGAVIRASRRSANRYEHPYPGALVHIDVKKLGRIPDGGGWKAHGRAATVAHKHKKVLIGYDYVHTAIDDHSRLAYAEICPDETGATSAAFLGRAAAYFAAHGITSIERVITGNAFAYRKSAAFAQAVATLGARQKFIRPHCPWQNGKAERLNRTLATEWAYRQPFTSSTERAQALPAWLEFYNTQRQHTALGGKPPITRLSPTS